MTQYIIDGPPFVTRVTLNSPEPRALSPLQRAFKRAVRPAFIWPEEDSTLLLQARPLTELPGIKPFLARQLSEFQFLVKFPNQCLMEKE